MKGYTIQHSIELLEKEAGSGSGGASTASEVSFDNTDTGLVATNVQSAISELAISRYFPTDANEHRIGDNLYIKKCAGESLASGEEVLIAGVTGDLLAAYGYVSESRYKFTINTYLDSNNSAQVFQTIESGDISIQTGTGFRGAYCIYVIYTKAAASDAKSTRKKK